MPFFNMFKPKRSRSGLSPSSSERFSDDSEPYDQAPGYGSRSTGNLGLGHTAPAHRSQLYANSRTQHYPRRGSTHRNSGPERYAQPEARDQDQSWYQVEHHDPDYHHGSQGDYYSEDGDRHSDAYGPASAVPHLISESSRVDSPVPTVHRQGAPGAGSRLYEQFAASGGLPPSAVTRVDLHEGLAAEDYDRPQRSTSTRSNPVSRHASASHQSLTSAGMHRHPHRRPQHPAFQGTAGVHIGPTSESSRSDVMQTLDNGTRITIPRHPERGRSGYGAHGPSANLERTYYIVPPGMNVIFRDEHGNELKRVGDFGANDAPYEYDEAPVEIADDRGRIMYKTGENFTDDGSDASNATDRPKIVHLGQYVSHSSSQVPRSASPITVSLDRRGYHRHIQLDHSEDGSFGGSQSQGSERSLSPHFSHAPSNSNPSGPPHPTANYMPRSRMDQVRLRTIYP